MRDTDPLTLQESEQAFVRGDGSDAYNSRGGAAGARGTGEDDTVDLAFIGCRHATYLDLGDLIDPVEIPAQQRHDLSRSSERYRAREKDVSCT